MHNWLMSNATVSRGFRHWTAKKQTLMGVFTLERHFLLAFEVPLNLATASCWFLTENGRVVSRMFAARLL